MEDIISRLRVLNFMGPWSEAADEIERLREALRLERQIKDAALALANDLQNQLNRMNGTYGFSVVAALKGDE